MHEVKSESEVAQSCPTLSDPMDCSLPGSSIHGIFQARVLEWVAITWMQLISFSVICPCTVSVVSYGYLVSCFILGLQNHCIDCSHGIKRCLLLERKVMTNLDIILKSRDITLPTKVHIVKAVVFSVVIYRCESWTIKKAEHQKIDAFELWCWRRLLRVPWTARRSNQSILKEISPEYSLEGLMLKLKLQYFGHLM